MFSRVHLTTKHRAQEHATKNKRSTLMADDVLAAIDDLELSQYKEELLETLKGNCYEIVYQIIHFTAYRKSQAAKKASKAGQKKESSSKSGDDISHDIDSEGEI